MTSDKAVEVEANKQTNQSAATLNHQVRGPLFESSSMFTQEQIFQHFNRGLRNSAGMRGHASSTIEIPASGSF
jgi:hypothetical protein